MKNCLSLITLITICSFKFISAQNLEIVVLGIAQDGGYPQANCSQSCCSKKDVKRNIASLGIVDLETNDFYMIDCTPDFGIQLRTMSNYTSTPGVLPKGIFLTHAHIGHYFGLAQLGKEVIGANKVPVFALPLMRRFLSDNAPWESLINENHIDLMPIDKDKPSKLSDRLEITPILVPHRDEYSETAGYLIKSKEESLLYIPDIDKWEHWEKDIIRMIEEVDYALLDGTFYDENELPNRDMSKIPHPFVTESINLFKDLSPLQKSKIHFIHFNHSNPLLDKKSKAYKTVYLNGLNVASEGLSFYLE